MQAVKYNSETSTFPAPFSVANEINQLTKAGRRMVYTVSKHERCFIAEVTKVFHIKHLHTNREVTEK